MPARNRQHNGFLYDGKGKETGNPSLPSLGRKLIQGMVQVTLTLTITVVYLVPSVFFLSRGDNNTSSSDTFSSQ